MKRIIPISLVLGLGLALTVRANFTTSPAPSAPLDPAPAAPQALEISVLEAHPFVLGEAEPDWMRPGAPSYVNGTLLVLEGPAELFVPRQALENVLYVGTQIPEPINTGAFSGRRIVILPGEFEPATMPVYFGEPALPGQVTLAEAGRQLDLAFDAGARAIGPMALPAPKSFASAYEMRRFAADLIEQFSPDEVDVISGLRVEHL